MRLHSQSACAPVEHVAVEVVRPRAGAIVVDYVVGGRIDDLCMPVAGPAARADALWRNCCFEAFVRAPTGAAYYEFNFSPSTRWAAYRFDDYRRGRCDAEVGAPVIAIEPGRDRFALRAALELDRLPDLPPDAPWQLGLAAVIEDAGGGLSYWALAHPPGKPDFHHPDGFALEVGVAPGTIPADANRMSASVTRHRRARP